MRICMPGCWDHWEPSWGLAIITDLICQALGRTSAQGLTWNLDIDHLAITAFGREARKMRSESQLWPWVFFRKCIYGENSRPESRHWLQLVKKVEKDWPSSVIGFLIFVFHCVMKECVREQWQIYFCCGWLQLNNSSGKMPVWVRFWKLQVL